MGWETRDYGRYDEGGGFKRAVRRIFGENENPLTWSLPLYTAWGIRVRVHLFYILWMVVMMISSLVRDGIGPQYTAMGIAALFILVLLHEYGHCFACRWVGGTANEILMWPLGGLAYCAPPHNWKADLITTLGGPGVNLLLWPILGGIIAALVAPGTWQEILFFNPFDPAVAMGTLSLPSGAQPFWLYSLWWLYFTNAILFLFNMLLPMYPLDSGRVLHAILWARVGSRRALAASANTGLVIAVLLGVFALTTRETGLLLGIALFGGFTCWMEKQRLKMTGDPLLDGYDFDRGYSGMPRDDDDPSAARAAKAAEKRRKEQEKEQAELDRLLAKIAKTGMGSLSGSEKRWLQRTTEKKRRQ